MYGITPQEELPPVAPEIPDLSITIQENEQHYGRFVVEPLERGVTRCYCHDNHDAHVCYQACPARGVRQSAGRGALACGQFFLRIPPPQT